MQNEFSEHEVCQSPSTLDVQCADCTCNNAGVHLIQVTSGLILDFLYSKTTKKLLANLEAGYVSYDTSPEHDYCDICTRHVIKW